MASRTCGFRVAALLGGVLAAHLACDSQPPAPDPPGAWTVARRDAGPSAGGAPAITPPQPEREEESEATEVEFGPKPVPSASDGSYPAVEAYLERASSRGVHLERCTQVHRTRGGWLVGCEWTTGEGTQGTGRQSGWFTIRDRQVVEMRALGRGR